MGVGHVFFGGLSGYAAAAAAPFPFLSKASKGWGWQRGLLRTVCGMAPVHGMLLATLLRAQWVASQAHSLSVHA